jgi:glycerophosphoryl diester phosphodiesterase
MIIAHRGASQDAPENTLAAFDLAWAQGADGFECDVQMTADGHIVCIHDADTLRVAGVKCVIKHSTLHELRALDAGAWFGRDWIGKQIPTLAEALGAVPAGKRIFIEVKCGAEILPQLIWDLDRSGVLLAQVMVISFNAGVIARLKARRPDVKACWITRLKSGMRGRLKPSARTVLTTLKKLHADGLSCLAHPLLDAAYIANIRSAGYEVHVWTVDELPLARELAEWGVRSISSNRPGYVRTGVVDDFG